MESLEVNSGKPSRYGNIFLVGSILSAGNTIPYFSKYTKHLVVYYLLKTLKGKDDYFEVYDNGSLQYKKTVKSISIPVVGYYFTVLFWYVKLLYSCFPKKQPIYVITYHPIYLLVHCVLRVLFRVKMILWVIDYIPNGSIGLRLYQYVLLRFARENPDTIFLSDSLNRLYYGKPSYNPERTVEWGLIQKRGIKKRIQGRTITAVFVGTIRKTDGLRNVLSLVAKEKYLKLKILGQSVGGIHEDLRRQISDLEIEDRVYFPNKYFTEHDLQKEFQKSTFGIALYDSGRNNPVFFTDSGKVKTYIQYGLPVMMTNMSTTAGVVAKFHAGVIVRQDVRSLQKGLRQLCRGYSSYIRGVERVIRTYNIEVYYRQKFSFIEEKFRGNTSLIERNSF